MKRKVTSLKDRAIMKVIACIKTSKTRDHLTGCDRMISLLCNYHGVKNTTLTYVTMMYKHKHREIHHG